MRILQIISNDSSGVCVPSGQLARGSSQTRFMPAATAPLLTSTWQTLPTCSVSLRRQLADRECSMQIAADMTMAGGPGVCACGSATHRQHVAPQASTARSSRAERLRSRAFTSGPLRRSRLLHLPTRGRPSPRQTLRPCAARNPLEEQLKQDSINVNLRSEAEAPWRSYRLSRNHAHAMCMSADLDMIGSRPGRPVCPLRCAAGRCAW
jgi:hypothetical protein